MLVKGGPDHHTDPLILNVQIISLIQVIMIGLPQKMDLWTILHRVA